MVPTQVELLCGLCVDMYMVHICLQLPCITQDLRVCVWQLA